MKIFLVFKTHFDIGFTDLAKNIVDQYAGKMLEQVIETCDGTTDLGALRYVWTMPSWPLKVMQSAEPTKRSALDRLIRSGQIASHALPFTTHFDFSGVEDAIQSLQYAVELSREYNLALPISAKMTDVPGHGRFLPTLLAGAGIKFLHLGCNDFPYSPDVPPLFFWEGPDGAHVLTMYSKSYGSALTPPDDWEYPVWMALMHTHDNCGPQSTDMIRGMASEVHECCPNASLACGTMDDFYHALTKCDLSNIPVVRGDLADTWIHGVGTYPAEVRQVRRARETLVAANVRGMLAHNTASVLAAHTRAAYDSLVLFDEHTWGLDVKTWLPTDRAYEKSAFGTRQQTEEYRRMEQSWNEQRVNAQHAADEAKSALEQDAGQTMSMLNPNGCTFTGWASAENAPNAVRMCGRDWLYAQELPALSATALPVDEVHAASLTQNGDALENHRYRLTIDRTRGIITELFDKQANKALLRARGDIGVFSYRYDVYGTDELNDYLRNYGRRFSDWGVRDNGRDNYPECEHACFEPKFECMTIDGYMVSLHYRCNAHEQYGDGVRLTVSVALPPLGDTLMVRVDLEDKAATAYVESGSLAMPLADEHVQYRFNKNGDLIDPSTDIVDNANHAFYCLEHFACAQSEECGLCVIAHDTPLCSIGETGVYAYRKQYAEHEQILYFNLFNTMWGTNFPQWICGDFTWEFTLFGYTSEKAPYAQALMLARGARVLPMSPAQSKITLPSQVQVLQCMPREDDTLILHLRDTGLSSREAVLSAQGCQITQVDLRGTPLGAPKTNSLSFPLAAFGVAAFEVQGKW